MVGDAAPATHGPNITMVVKAKAGFAYGAYNHVGETHATTKKQNARMAQNDENKAPGLSLSLASGLIMMWWCCWLVHLRCRCAAFWSLLLIKVALAAATLELAYPNCYFGPTGSSSTAMGRSHAAMTRHAVFVAANSDYPVTGPVDI